MEQSLFGSLKIKYSIKSISIAAFLCLFPVLGQAALVFDESNDICVAAGGCTPDFNINSTSAAMIYTANVTSGTGGTLKVTGAFVENMIFKNNTVRDSNGSLLGDGTVVGSLNVDGHAFDAAGAAGFIGMQTQATGDKFNLTLNLDGNGAILNGTVSLNGRVFDTLSTGIPNAAQSLDGNPLDGLLLDGTVGSLSSWGVAYNALDDLVSLRMLGGTVTGGVLNDYSDFWALNGTLNTFNTVTGLTGSDYLDNDWSTNSYSLNVVVPIPSAAVLFFSGLVGLFSWRKSQFGLRVK